MKNISYTGIILDNKSRQLLAEKYKQMMPDGWEWIAHHMTITMGSLPKEKLDLLGTEQSITAESLGMTDMVMEIGVSGFESKNTQPHVTLAVNRKDGGKPFMSNNITDWQPIEEKFILTGQIKEVGQPDQPMKKNLKEIVDINDLPFKSDVTKAGGKIYQVGGAVRDTFLNKTSKDLDILITGVPSDKLQSILSKYGKVDLVGASFGIIKFTPPGGEEIDIALPRTEKAKKQIVVTLGQNDIFIEYNDSMNERELKG